MANSSSNSNSGCGGCLSALVIGTLIVGTVALGGCGKAWHKVKSSWDYDNKMQIVQKIFDVNKDGIFQDSERLEMIDKLGISTIEGEISSVKIPYENLLDYTKKYNQEF